MYSIKDLTKKIKGFRDEHRPEIRPLPNDIFLAIVIILVAFGSFGLGRLSKIESARTPVRIENAPEASADLIQNNAPGASKAVQVSNQASSEGATLVGSKSGSKYHYAWCAGAQRIAEANRIYFTTTEEARAKGYTPASNCPGLQ